MAHLTHPNTVKVVDYGELEDGSLYIIMEYLEGKNLNQVVRKEGPFPPERAIPILIQVCGALQEAHLQGIVHRDLKPENIFLSVNAGLKDYPKVLDFGLAKVTERELRPGSIMLTQEGMVFGTPEFMSPEQAQGKVLDARSDIYSLAVILYEVLTGKLPFDARTPMEYIQMHVNKPPMPLDERVQGKTFPPGLWGVLKKALEKKVEDRYGSAAEFAEALKPYAGTAGKGFTAMMPANTSAVLEQAAKQHAAALEAAMPAKPGGPGQAPAAGSPIRPAPTMKMDALPGPAQLARQHAQASRHSTSPMLLAGIAASCLIAGIVLTIVVMKLLG